MEFIYSAVSSFHRRACITYAGVGLTASRHTMACIHVRSRRKATTPAHWLLAWSASTVQSGHACGMTSSSELKAMIKQIAAKAIGGDAPTHTLSTQSVVHPPHCPSCTSDITSHCPVAMLQTEVPHASDARVQGLGSTARARQPDSSNRACGSQTASRHGPNPPAGTNPSIGSLKGSSFRFCWRCYCRGGTLAASRPDLSNRLCLNVTPCGS